MQLEGLRNILKNKEKEIEVLRKEFEESKQFSVDCTSTEDSTGDNER